MRFGFYIISSLILDKTKDKSGAEYTLLYDEGYSISNSYDVNFLPLRKSLMKYNTFTAARLKHSHSDDSQRLPVPATYIIDTNHIIIWRQFDPDYKNRSLVSEILKVLNGNTRP